MKALTIGQAYHLRGILPRLWGNAHPTYGQPVALAGLYLGSLAGTRLWHGFEVWIDGRDAGVIFMNQQDLDQLTVSTVPG